MKKGEEGASPSSPNAKGEAIPIPSPSAPAHASSA